MRNLLHKRVMDADTGRCLGTVIKQWVDESPFSDGETMVVTLGGDGQSVTRFASDVLAEAIESMVNLPFSTTFRKPGAP